MEYGRVLRDRRGPNNDIQWVSLVSPTRCPSEYLTSGNGRWMCTRPKGHGGLHLGGFPNGTWGAEWYEYPVELLFPEGV